MRSPRVVRGAPGVQLSHAEFLRRFLARFADPTFREVGDAAGVEQLGTMLRDWLTDLELIPAGPSPGIARYLGYYGDYATSHDDLDRDRALQAEVRNAAKSLVETIRQIRTGRYVRPDADLEAPRQK